ncbi:MAG: hypothetical protein FVQ79_13835 [Planctomycetes bacterium]|nr:hypothetical protein [Planctomycetota bacterium]
MMELEEHIKSLAKRAKSRVGNVIVAYEVKKWPEGRLEQLLKMRVLRSLPDADEIRCPGCTKRHMIVPIRTILPNGDSYSEHLCSKEGLIPIPEFLFKRWEIVTEEESPKDEANKKSVKPLNVRVGSIVIKHPKANSEEIAKLVGSTDGSVRTTLAWTMRKQLRQRYDTKKGWKDSEGSMDAYSEEIQAEHWDIYNMFQDYKSGKNPDYPSIVRIAEKLKVKEARAKEFLKQAKSMLEFEADKID